MVKSDHRTGLYWTAFSSLTEFTIHIEFVSLAQWLRGWLLVREDMSSNPMAASGFFFCLKRFSRYVFSLRCGFRLECFYQSCMNHSGVWRLFQPLQCVLPLSVALSVRAPNELRNQRQERSNTPCVSLSERSVTEMHTNCTGNMAEERKNYVFPGAYLRRRPIWCTRYTRWYASRHLCQKLFKRSSLTTIQKFTYPMKTTQHAFFEEYWNFITTAK